MLHKRAGEGKLGGLRLEDDWTGSGPEGAGVQLANLRLNLSVPMIERMWMEAICSLPDISLLVRLTEQSRRDESTGYCECHAVAQLYT